MKIFKQYLIFIRKNKTKGKYFLLFLFSFSSYLSVYGQGQETLLTKLEATACGITYQNDIVENGFYNHIAWENVYHGAGVAIGDLNNDGLSDVVFAGNQMEDQLYLNQGNFQFKNNTKNLNAPANHYWSNGVTLADINADGWLDIYISKSGRSLNSVDRRNLLFINNRDNTFTEKAAQYGLADEGYSMQATFFDMDNDGDLDAYIMNQPPSTQQEKLLDRIESGPCDAYTDNLYRNDNGQFINITKKAGVENCAYGLGIVATDINQDGWIDLYISNDYFVSDHLYINQRDGTFKNEAQTNFKHESLYAMGVDVADFNNDGLLDVFTADMSAEDHYRNKANMSSMNRHRFQDIIKAGYNYQFMFNALQLNNGNGHFSEIAQLAGVANTDWSWGTLFIDLDNNGYKDLLISNGIKRDVRFVDGLNKLRESLKDGTIKVSEILTNTPSEKLKNYAFENKGNLQFKNTSKKWGFALESFSNGMAYGDLDNDGDLDLIVNNVDEAPFIFKNNSQQNYLTIQLKGTSLNPFAYGAKAKIESNGQTQIAEVSPTRGYLSAATSLIHFGLGATKIIDKLTIFWPDGKTAILNNVSANQQLDISYEDAAKKKEISQTNSPIFHPYSFPSEQPIIHYEIPYNPFTKEVLLPHKLSQLGPAIAVADVNKDGLDDVFVGGAKGESSQLLIQLETGVFKSADALTWSLDADAEDIEAVFFDADNDGNIDLYVASGSNEFASNAPQLQDRLYLNKGSFFLHDVEALPPMLQSTGAVKPMDFDMDGDMDLFVGGLMEQQNYPYPATSYLLKNENGKFIDVTHDLAPALQKVGMVRDAVWTDFDGDQDQDLIVVGEWMNINLFENREGHFIKYNSTDLAETAGMWHSIVAYDFDDDGDDDYLVGNLGLNNKYKRDAKKGFHLFSNDFDGNGSNDIVLSKESEGQFLPVRGRECTSEQIPMMAEKFPTFHQFATASLEDIYTPEKLATSLHKEIKEMGSIYIENKGKGGFKWQQLPMAAQVSVITDFVVKDFDMDGIVDVLAVGNKYETEVETARYDAGKGLLLKGNGKGDFETVSPASSGLLVDGNMRAAAAITIKNQTAIIIGINEGKIESRAYR